MADTPPGVRGPTAADRLGEEAEPRTALESLPPFTFRHGLIPAVQSVVSERFDAGAPELAVVYAEVTARSATALLSGEKVPYSVFTGKVFVRLSGEEGAVVGPGVEPASGLLVHAWAGRVRLSGRLEVADLSTRHFGTWLAGSGLPPGIRFPRAVWAFDDEVPRAFRYVSEAADSVRPPSSLSPARADAVASAVREVLARFRTGSG
ncbi:MAG: hypothetical protein RBU36_07875 [Thermoanaerobaculia bacterium]|jgi:hypothetical protein|nr:hypothetical protein [Thermoanaerobaculia bacterium]